MDFGEPGARLPLIILALETSWDNRGWSRDFLDFFRNRRENFGPAAVTVLRAPPVQTQEAVLAEDLYVQLPPLPYKCGSPSIFLSSSLLPQKID